MLRFIILFFTALINLQASALDSLNISLAGDMVYDHGLNDSSTATEKLTMRGAELTFYSPIDHQFDGVLSAAAHDEGGETVFELHELYLSSSKLIPGLGLKAGQFFLGIGRLNKVHQHDWAFTTAPKVHETFFDSEGVFDAGLEASYLLPTSHYFNLTLGVTSGYRYGHSHTAGSKPKVPTHYMNFETFFPLNNTNGLNVGLNYLGRKDEQGNSMRIAGVDFVAKWRRAKSLLYLIQSEWWYRDNEDALGSHSDQAGFYLFNQYGLASNKFVGFRVDGYKDFSKINALSSKKINHINYGFTPTYTYKSSEFATIRLSLSHSFSREEGITTEKDTRIETQFVFILGAHPAHDF